jgi:hypothetical protein
MDLNKRLSRIAVLCEEISDTCVDAVGSNVNIVATLNGINQQVTEIFELSQGVTATEPEYKPTKMDFVSKTPPLIEGYVSGGKSTEGSKLVTCSYAFIRTSEKALCCELDIEEPSRNGQGIWIPYSQITNNTLNVNKARQGDLGNIEIPYWLYDTKVREYRSK